MDRKLAVRKLVAQVVHRKTQKVLAILGTFTDSEAAWRAFDRHKKANAFTAKSSWRYRLLRG
jgi:hypothetical protein